MGRLQISRREMILGAAGLAGLPALPASAAGKSERLQITKVELFKVVVPIQPDIINRPEFGPDGLTEFPTIPKFIIKIHTDSGIAGVGETSRGLKDEEVQKTADYLLGKKILDMNLTRLDLPIRGTYRGFEIAVYDAVGKAIGWPVYQLLGGLAQPKVQVNYWCGRKNPVDIKRAAQRAVAGNFNGIKVKGRPGDPIVKAIEAIAEVSPNLKVTVDFNSYYQQGGGIHRNRQGARRGGQHAGDRRSAGEEQPRGLPGASAAVENSVGADNFKPEGDHSRHTGGGLHHVQQRTESAHGEFRLDRLGGQRGGYSGLARLRARAGCKGCRDDALGGRSPELYAAERHSQPSANG